jgi:threonine aldolase
MKRPIELRSDTFTRPTEAMRRAMYEAEVGDDVWGEDPTVQRLEERASELLGKEAAVFVSSGTQGNLIGVLAHTQPGTEVVLGDKSHIVHHEAGGVAAIGGVMTRTLPNGSDGMLQPEQVARAIRNDDIHEPPTRLIALENTHNQCNGAVLSRADMAAVADIAHARGIPVHLDGARLFNAVAALGTPVSELVEPVDSVTFCLSKGLGAPVGSILLGSEEYIARARRWRKMLGGGMRQVGVIAAPGLLALERNRERLAEDNANARHFAEGLAEIRGIDVDAARVQSNIVYFDIAGVGADPSEFLAALQERGVLLAGEGTVLRAVTSYEVDRQGIEDALEAIRQVAGRTVAVPA